MPRTPRSHTDTPAIEGRLNDTLRLHGLTGIVAPASIAVVGASPRNLELVENVQRGGRPATGIHPTRTEVAGLRCVAGLADLPATPDLAILAVGPSTIGETFAQALQIGVRSFVLPGLGVEAGDGAHEIVQRLTALADDAGAAILGHNCMGLAVPSGPSSWLGTVPATFLPGGIGIVSQSGSIADAFLAIGPRCGFTAVISCGGEANRDAADWIAHLADDPETTVIGVFLEAVRRPRAFRQALRMAADAGKPVVCLKIGRTEAARRSALAHTGAIVGSHESFTAMLDTHGVIQVHDLPAMIDLLDVLSKPRRPAGRRVGVVTESGAEAALLGDHAEPHGLTFPPVPAPTANVLKEQFPLLPVNNPLDPWAIAEPVAAFSAAVAAMADSGAYDVLLAQVDLSRYRGPSEQRWCRAVVEALVAARERTGVVTAVTTVHQTDPPDELARYALEHSVSLLKGAGAGLAALATAATWTPLTASKAGPSDDTVATADAELGDPGARVLSEWESSQLLERRGIRFAPRALAATPGEAAQAASALGFPVVVKTDGVAHKARAGGVVLDVDDAEAAAAAATRLAGPVIVARQLPTGTEAFCGMVRDRHYGPVFVVGRGGGAVEDSRPVTALGPMSTALAEHMVDRAGFHRWSEPLVSALLALDDLARSARVAEIDVNPLICSESGQVDAVDALVVLTASTDQPDR